ncbi:uncharacterized protein B0I36DRAFT_244161 [Microdochium trichocladiopsis]|uniref:Peptidase M6-like domain-containing protein n=1 Tax=Microdochium trichocladiopsis TaxID=1682393 RepID=A0A9P8Y584_9PEZI|nr:uncharacterized protein B0I36DRAFT_244161 [Microdochium trichocladiopsis]KAH7029265.1 hypothetical protein B0I36DRAFT_244161 [Microdochium trichocladiopsis]
MASTLVSAVLTAGLWLPQLVRSAPLSATGDPFAVLDPQNWVNPDNMTWDDYVRPPGTNWGDASKRGSIRNFNIALVAVDYPDMPFVITQPPESTVFKNPQPVVSAIERDQVPAFYRDLLNTQNELNRGHTLHEYWMEDSSGRYGVDLTAFGPYKLPAKSYQYGVDTGGFNPGACPTGERCSVNIRTDALGAWRNAIGSGNASSYELVFILSAGQDESSTWQEFGEMMFQTKEDVSDDFGPPDVNLTNYAKTRYVEWTSWAAASTIWPNAGSGSSTQAESSGMGTYAHELSHLLGIGDNYANSFVGRRDYMGPFAMLSRGSFNGPGGPHTRWHIPAQNGGALGSLHTVREKTQLGLLNASEILTVSREQLPSLGLIVTELIARSVQPGDDHLVSLKISLDKDLSSCDYQNDPLCDGGNFEAYELEVIDRMGADSFTTDSGVMITKTRRTGTPFQWIIDANPQDIGLVDFYRPDGSPAMVTIGDYRQMSDALFHAGTRSGSEFEYVDEANRIHLYILDVRRDESGVLFYTVGARSLDGAGPISPGVDLTDGIASGASALAPGLSCAFELTNPGSSAGTDGPDQALTSALQSDIYRLSVAVEGDGWRAVLPNELATARFGERVVVNVAVGAETGATSDAIVHLTVISESDSSVSATKDCKVRL